MKCAHAHGEDCYMYTSSHVQAQSTGMFSVRSFNLDCRIDRKSGSALTSAFETKLEEDVGDLMLNVSRSQVLWQICLPGVKDVNDVQQAAWQALIELQSDLESFVTHSGPCTALQRYSHLDLGAVGCTCASSTAVPGELQHRSAQLHRVTDLRQLAARSAAVANKSYV